MLTTPFRSAADQLPKYFFDVREIYFVATESNQLHLLLRAASLVRVGPPPTAEVTGSNPYRGSLRKIERLVLDAEPLAGPANAHQIRWSQSAIARPTSSGLSSCSGDL